MSASKYDMTVGNPTGLLLRFAIPMFVGNLFQQLYNMVDSAIVGRFVGANALAAVGASGSLTWLFFSLVFGLSCGIGIIVSQYFGAKDEAAVKRTIATGVYIMLASSVLICMITFFSAKPVMLLLHTPSELLKDAVLYLRIVGIGMLAIGVYDGVSSVLRALGDSVTPIIFLAIACGLNIILDFVFVIYLGLGVLGVAVATVIAETVAAVGIAICAWGFKPIFKIPLKEYVIDKDILRKSFQLGMPMALQSSLIAASCVVLQGVVNSFGATIMAAYTVACRFEQLVQQGFDAIGMAVGTYTGQNVGANQLERVKKGFWSAAKLSVCFSLIMIVVTLVGGEAIMKIFTDKPDVIYEGARGIRIDCLFYVGLGMIYVSRSILNGAGDTKFTMIAGVIEVICRVGFARPLTFVPFIGMLSIWFTSGFTWTITSIALAIRYFGGKWKGKGVVAQTKEAVQANDGEIQADEVKVSKEIMMQ